MAPSKFRQAIGAVKDSTSIGLAIVGISRSIESDLDIAIVKATRHENYPPDEKYIREIISLTCYSRAYISSCVNTLARRLNKTRNWIVALKTLMLIHRLLVEGDLGYEQEIYSATRRGTRLLNLSDFRDSSQSDSWDYSSFVRTYALYLDERLEYRVNGQRVVCCMVLVGDGGNDNAIVNTPVRDMNNELIYIRVNNLQRLLERLLACRPTGSAKNDRVVVFALYPLLKESFHLYFDITEIINILVERFMELPLTDCVKVYEIFERIGEHFNELDMFYNWCKSVGIARSSEFPEVDKITTKKLQIMDEFIRDKSSFEEMKRAKNQEDIDTEIFEQEENNDPEDDMNAIKALPPPENFPSSIEEVEENYNKGEEDNKQQEGDLLNLGDYAVSSEDHGDKLALALFGCGEVFSGDAPPPWEAFKEDSTDWETALVVSASTLPNQKASLGGGFDKLLLDGMYQQSAVSAAAEASLATGSASSVALGSAGKPAMLALPAPTVSVAGASAEIRDPFTASLSVPPPAYVEMSEMEKKQKLLVEEQLMWQQYQMNGTQGQLGFAQLYANQYNMGGYTRGY